jgi:hypothetical protein
MKLLRHLMLVVVVIVAISGLGLAWEHSSAARWISGPSRPTPVPPIFARPHRPPPEGHVQIGFAGPNLADTRNLVTTIVIGLVIACGVVTVDRVWRRRRRRS